MGDERYHCTLADACKAVNYGLTASASSHPIGPSFLRITDIVPGFVDWNTVPYVAADNDLLTKYALDDGDIVIARTGASTGASAYVKSPPSAVFASYLVRLKVKPEFDARYVSYFLKSPMFLEYIRGVLGDKSAQPNASASTMTAAPLSAPRDKVVQRAIAHILGTLDDKIELNRRMNETLEAMARALFKDWFVDFGPVHATPKGRASYLAPEIWDLFPSALDSEELPTGWRMATIGDAFHLTMGQSPPGSTYNDSGEGLPFFQGRADFGFRYPKTRKYCSAPTRVAERGDTLVSVRAPVGDINMAWEKCCVGRGVAALRHRIGSRSFTYYALQAIQQKLKHYEHTGTVFGAINKRQFEPLGVVEPTPEIISLFEKVVDPLDERIRKNVSESRTLAHIRDMLLSKLISGEFRLRDAEKVVEVVA